MAKKPKKSGAARKGARKAAPKSKGKPKGKPSAKSRGKRPARKPAPPPRDRGIAHGFVSHTDLGSRDPAATKAWAERVLGWQFAPPLPTPTGDYHMWDFGNRMGGGIRRVTPPEAPGSIPYCEVAEIRPSFERALAAGATPIQPPTPIGPGMGSTAIVEAPGGIAIGFWSAE